MRPEAFTCLGKASYSKRAARRAAINVSASSGENLHAYLCGHCHCWHIGHQSLHKADRRTDEIHKPALTDPSKLPEALR